MSRTRSLLTLWTAAAAAVAVAGCGGAAAGEATSENDPAAVAAVDGRALFRERCAACHALADAKADGAIGPDLDTLRPDPQRVEQKVRNGGGGMPPFSGQLSDAEITAVAAYVGEASGR